MKKNQPDKNASLLRFAGIGFQMVVYIGIFVAAGYWLDRKFGTSKPWFTLVLSLCGCVFGLWYLIRTLTKQY